MKKQATLFLLFLAITSFSYSQTTVIEERISVENTSNPYPGLDIYSHDGSNSISTSHPIVVFNTSGGTENNLSTLGANRVLGSFIFAGYDGSSYYQSARLEVQSLSTFTPSDHSAQMNFRIGGGNTGITRMTIDGDSGNVGIGTTNPDERLTVNGSIHAKEIRVNLNIPADYVFEKYYDGFSDLKPTYTMPSLEEVETFTKENNHLPGVPSAQDIKEEGLHLKEMTNLLLQKIEELTLYTIEQEKRIQELESKLK